MPCLIYRQLLQQAEKLNGRTSFKAYAKLQQALLHMTKAEFKDNRWLHASNNISTAFFEL
jgi:hypothetical protein